jgi:CheY-like chemotaxis protein
MKISLNRKLGCSNTSFFRKDLFGSTWPAQPAFAVGLSSTHDQFLLRSNTSNVIPADQPYPTVDLRIKIREITARICAQIADIAVSWTIWEKSEVPSSVLLVEDEDEVRQVLVEALLSKGGFNVIEAATISAARDVLARAAGTLDLMVLDVGLPDGDGREFCAALRQQGVVTPVIFLTGLTGEDDLVRGFEAGGDDYLVKPFGVGEFLSRVGAQLRHAGHGPE